MGKRVLLIACVLLAVVCASLCRYSKQLKVDNQRLELNQQSLLFDCEVYKTEAGKNAAKVQQLTLTNEEFESQCGQLKAKVEELGIKASRLQQIINTTSSTEVEVRTEVRDSIIYVEATGQPDTLRCIDWSDSWVRVHGCIDAANNFEGGVESRDSLIIVAHRVPKRFLFFRWGCKRVELDIVSSNPHTQINHAKWVEFTKK